MFQALINEWEVTNRKYVEKTSGGRFGYVPVRSMMDPDYAKYRVFIARYLANFEGVVLDFRYNQRRKNFSPHS